MVNWLQLDLDSCGRCSVDLPEWGPNGSIGEAGTAPVSETRVTVFCLAQCSWPAICLHSSNESNGCHHSFQRAGPRTYHAVASTIFSVPKLFVKQILPSISAIFEGERERGGEGQCGAQIAFSVPGSLGPLWDPPTGAQPLQCSTGLVCNPRIRPFALV
jgi:hypothetical protein